MRAQIALNQSATYAAMRAPDASLRSAKEALLLLLKGARLNSARPVPHESAIRALLSLPTAKVVLLQV